MQDISLQLPIKTHFQLKFLLGLTAIQIRRFERCWKSSKPCQALGQKPSQDNSSRNRESSTESHKSINNTLKDSTKNAMPWKDKRFGFIPHPKTG